MLICSDLCLLCFCRNCKKLPDSFNIKPVAQPSYVTDKRKALNVTGLYIYKSFLFEVLPRSSGINHCLQFSRPPSVYDSATKMTGTGC